MPPPVLSRLVTRWLPSSDRFEPSTPPDAAPVDDRFWDETLRLPGMFERCREARDHVNAAACFGRLARARYAEAIKGRGYDASRRSIVSVFQPKSGGTFLHNRLLESGYTDFWWLFPDRLCHSYCYASDEALAYFLRGGFACHTHARPEPNVLAALDRAGVERIWLHLRNPAETAVSAYHHFRGEGHGEGETGAERRDDALRAAPGCGVTPDTTLSDYVAANIGWHIDWVVQWLEFLEEHPSAAVVSTYAELAKPQALLARVCRALGAPPPGEVTHGVLPADRFRVKATDDWRHGLTPTVERYVEQRVAADLGRFAAYELLGGWEGDR